MQQATKVHKQAAKFTRYALTTAKSTYRRKSAAERTWQVDKEATRTLNSSICSSVKPFFLNLSGVLSSAIGWCPTDRAGAAAGAAATEDACARKKSSEMVWMATHDDVFKKKKRGSGGRGERGGEILETLLC